MTYVDGFVLVVPEENIAKYKEMAQGAGEVWKKHGALEYFECVQDDMNPHPMSVPMVKFPELAKAKEGEMVVFSFIIFQSREHRDEVNKKVMNEMQEKYKDEDCMKDMPFDMARMAYGGFKAIVEERND